MKTKEWLKQLSPEIQEKAKEHDNGRGQIEVESLADAIDELYWGEDFDYWGEDTLSSITNN